MLCEKCKNAKRLFNQFFCLHDNVIITNCKECKNFAGKNKYHNATCKDSNGDSFDSKKELARWNELQLLQKNGGIKNLERQKKFLIVPKTPGERAAYYVADFVYVENETKIIEDVKSKITRKNPTYILKRKLVKSLYPDYKFVET